MDSLSWQPGYLFPTKHGRASAPSIGKDTVGRTLKAVRSEFPLEGLQVPRSHSGRRHQITNMIRTGVDEAVGMAFSRHTSRGIYSGYGQLNTQVGLTIHQSKQQKVVLE